MSAIHSEQPIVPAVQNMHLENETNPSLEVAPPNDASIPLPCVLPQTTKALRGAFFSPFVRAYPPALSHHGITQATFLAFIDGLNEAFVANPVTQVTSIAGAVMAQFYGIHPVQWAGIGLQTASGLASAATSYLRTRAYVKAVNTDLFHPAGLHLNVMTTAKMMAKVGHPEEKLSLGSLETFDTLDTDLKPKEAAKAANVDTTQDDFRIRRIKALEGYIMPLDFDVPDAESPDNLLRKMGASQAKRMATKQHKKLTKERTKGHEDYLKKIRKSDKEWRKGTEEVEKVERKLEKERTKMESKIARSKSPEKAQREFEKEERKLLKELEKKKGEREEEAGKERKEADKEREKVERKEDKTANKIRWLVISSGMGKKSRCRMRIVWRMTSLQGM